VIPLGMINVMQGTAQRLALVAWWENLLAKRKKAFAWPRSMSFFKRVGDQLLQNIPVNVC
jgi:hypothetical protein